MYHVNDALGAVNAFAGLDGAGAFTAAGIAALFACCEGLPLGGAASGAVGASARPGVGTSIW